ncbi:hypothetical protein METBIDRAFT_29812 [Metschnikowia bicuspidata var. bicuspidata NRRL YB-4993]|uniref:Uncharacterized protein n=1 Tax=Metschnikowia bicuspidata var. bicuspidata NRRL YB-4993 TaxID=869754 RepID=A0A1A0HGK8_9ASCO|nr:hypothetical protein METBIDRAFT_29812 [Metschnikowia bicuspidata var. bicuspidata NRRL YB-4993]OBA23304.1 hypothetical protein METBIDRAFT_29812 [Metschnikowia bicuspidata var. bicuspidata NRRL YB-4993]
MAAEEGENVKFLRGTSNTAAKPQGTASSISRRANSYQLQSNAGEPRTSEDLRQTALRNGLTRVNSASRVDGFTNSGRSHMTPKNRNIPMVAAPVVGRISDNRWGTYSLNQPINNVLVPTNESISEPHEDLNVAQKASISPLTQIHRPTGKTHSFDQAGIEINESKRGDLRSEKTSRGSSRSSLRDFHPRERSVGRFPDKKSNHNSMFSLVPMGLSDSEAEVCGDERALLIEADKSEDLEALYEENYEEAYLQIPGLADATSVLDFMKGHEKAQETKQSIDAVSIGSSLDRPTTRTHQKLLDMKLLRLRQEAASAASTATLAMGGLRNLPEYAVKIQHESVVSQWTQIRLRFSSHPENTEGRRTNIACRAGVLGSIKRNEAELAMKAGDRRALESRITKDNVASYLHEMWHDQSFETQPGDVFFDAGNLVDNGDQSASADMMQMAKNVLLTRT